MRKRHLRMVSFKTTEAQWRTLNSCALAYRAANVSHFLREMVTAMTSGSAEDVRDFNVRLMSGFGRVVGEQLTLEALSAGKVAPHIKPTPRLRDLRRVAKKDRAKR